VWRGADEDASAVGRVSGRGAHGAPSVRGVGLPKLLRIRAACTDDPFFMNFFQRRNFASAIFSESRFIGAKFETFRQTPGSSRGSDQAMDLVLEGPWNRARAKAGQIGQAAYRRLREIDPGSSDIASVLLIASPRATGPARREEGLPPRLFWDFVPPASFPRRPSPRTRPISFLPMR